MKANQGFPKPWCCQIELVEGCNRICPFCGLNGIRDKVGNYKYVDWETINRTINGISELMPTGRLEFAMHGEPTMHPEYLGILRAFRKALPKVQMQITTNGKVIRPKMQERMEAIFDVGVDFVILDTYHPERDEMREAASKLKGIEVKDYYVDCVPQGWSPWANHHRKVRRRVVLMDDLLNRDGETRARTIYNQAGNTKFKGDQPELPLQSKCTMPFREIAVTWNGNVNICCMDWGHELVCGNVNDMPLSGIWEGPIFQAIRKVLNQKSREFSPCVGCDYKAKRIGLLPKMPLPTEADKQVLRQAVDTPTATNGHKPYHNIK